MVARWIHLRHVLERPRTRSRSCLLGPAAKRSIDNENSVAGSTSYSRSHPIVMDGRASSASLADCSGTLRRILRSLEPISPMKPVTIVSSSKALTIARLASATADKNEARASAVHYSRSRDAFAIELRNGIELVIPRRLLQGLAEATSADASRVMIVDKGAGLRWPTLDVDLAVPGLVSGIFGTKTWMSELGRAGGCKRSAARAAASRANGQRGGRPRKQHAPP
jgi:hypothetical protein